MNSGTVRGLFLVLVGCGLLFWCAVNAAFAEGVRTTQGTLWGSVTGDILPSADSTWDLGAAGNEFAEGHIDGLFAGAVAITVNSTALRHISSTYAQHPVWWSTAATNSSVGLWSGKTFIIMNQSSVPVLSVSDVGDVTVVEDMFIGLGAALERIEFDGTANVLGLFADVVSVQDPQGGGATLYVGSAVQTDVSQVQILDGGADNKPGELVLYADDSTPYYLWISTAGDLRGHTAAPSTGDDDADGVLIADLVP